ncbi:MAG: histidine kinase, partial [Bifidobacteriaceae bacterium]|nr:histidine kinase [Bifidobacteriaceae bacterium]
MLAPDALPNTPTTEPKARARLWDAVVGSTIGMGVGFALFVQRPDGPPWLPFIACAVALGVSALAYAPRGQDDSDASYQRWLRASQPAFEMILLGLAIASAALGFYDQPEGERSGALALALGLLLVVLVGAYLGFLRPGMPWIEPIPAAKWWMMTVLVGATLGVATAIAPAMGIFQVVLYVVLWATSGTEALVGRLVAGTVVVGGCIFVGTTLSRGLLTALLCQLPAMVLSGVTGGWLRSSWRWNGERHMLMTSLEQALGQLSAAEREAGVMAERERMSREIHDTIAQSLVGIIMTAQRAQGRRGDLAGSRSAAPEDGRRGGRQGGRQDGPRGGGGAEDAGLMEDLEVIVESAFGSLSDARALVAEGAHLDLAGSLESALADLGARFARETGLRVETETDLPLGLPQPVRLLVVRTVQEGLANVRKHTDARNISVAAVFLEGSLRIQIVDDGAGLGAQPPGVGFGLAGLRERVEVLGGRVEL